VRKTTFLQVQDILESFAFSALQNYDLDVIRRAYPFHRLIFDDIGLVAFKRERSVVTRMGQTLYPELARVIAMDSHADVARGKSIEGELPTDVVNVIGQIVRELRSGQRMPNHVREMDEILAANWSTEPIWVRVIADLFIGDYVDGPFFAEIKTPRPNLDICAETKTKILTFESLLLGEHARGHFGFPYNPFVTRAAYGHGFTRRIMDMDAEVLMADEFWDAIGGMGTFDTLLALVDQVGEEVRRQRSANSTAL
jgi:hypothetical protein